MIVTKKRSLEEIKEELKKSDTISLVSCNVCASVCKTGGLKGLAELKNSLQEEGYSITSDQHLVAACSRDLKERMKVPTGSTVLVLACDAGMINIERMCPEKQVVSATDTVGLGSYNQNGEISIVREFK